MLQDYTLDERINRETMNRVILKDLGARMCITNTPTVFKFLLEEFFNKWNYNIGKMLDSMYLDYDPLSNKNLTREEDRTDTRNDTIGNTRTNDLTTEVDGSDKINTSAYDVSTYQPRTETVTDNTTTNTGTVTDEGSLDRTDTGDLDVKEYGKDGTESYQTLIEQERRLAKFNIYNWIIQQMRRELFLLIY